MADDRIEVRRQKLQAYAKQLPDRYFQCDQKLAIFDLFTRPEICALFGDSYGAHGHNALTLTLMLDIVRDIYAFVLDRDGRTASLFNVFTMLGDPEVQEAACEDFSKPYATHLMGNFYDEMTADQRAQALAQIEAVDRSEKRASFQEIIADVRLQLPALLESDVAKKVSTARSKAIAHYQMRGCLASAPELFRLADVGLAYGDARRFLKEIEAPLLDVVLVSTGASYTAEEFRKRSRLYAADFLARLRGLPPVIDVPNE